MYRTGLKRNPGPSKTSCTGETSERGKAGQGRDAEDSLRRRLPRARYRLRAGRERAEPARARTRRTGGRATWVLSNWLMSPREVSEPVRHKGRADKLSEELRGKGISYRPMRSHGPQVSQLHRTPRGKQAVRAQRKALFLSCMVALPKKSSRVRTM